MLHIVSHPPAGSSPPGVLAKPHHAGVDNNDNVIIVSLSSMIIMITIVCVYNKDPCKAAPCRCRTAALGRRARSAREAASERTI